MRCAIYTRKSADERTNSQLGSITRQRELCETYIKSQEEENWTILPDLFDDEGYSGGVLKRPALDRLRQAAELGEVDAVVLYKIDRLSRSLRDFITLVKQFDQLGVRLVAITQHLDTNTSAGRLMINVLLSFAQFERELTSDRLKDWVAGARARGLYQGVAPYGYRNEKMHLIKVPEEAEVVRKIYRRYCYLRSGPKVLLELAQASVQFHGKPFPINVIYRILRSRVYLGELKHNGAYLPGVHEPLITEAQWLRSQTILNRRPWGRGDHTRDVPLHRLVFDANGVRMNLRRAQTKGRFYSRHVPAPSPGVHLYKTSPAFNVVKLELAVITALKSIGFTVSLEELESAHKTLRTAVARIDLREKDMTITLTTGLIFSIGHNAATSGRKPRFASLGNDLELMELYHKGANIKEIAVKLGKGKSTICKALRRLNVPRRDGTSRVPGIAPAN